MIDTQPDNPTVTPDSVDVPVPGEETEQSPSAAVTFQGNNYDLMGVVGVTIGGIMLLSCATLNMGFYCLPLVPVILGIVGLLSADESVDPARTRLLSWISLGAGGIIILAIIAFILLYLAIIGVAFMADSGGF